MLEKIFMENAKMNVWSPNFGAVLKIGCFHWKDKENSRRTYENSRIREDRWTKYSLKAKVFLVAMFKIPHGTYNSFLAKIFVMPLTYNN